MKKVIIIAIVLFCTGWTVRCSSNKEPVATPSQDSLPQWVESLNEIPLPNYMQRDPLINVYFKYNQLVNGYEVTARWMPFDTRTETGTVIMNFLNKETGKEFQYYGEKYHSFDTDGITFAEDFKGHKNGDVYYFNYTSPDTIDSFKESNGNSPLGYYTSFQFLDIDFDGKDELFVSDMYQGRGGNNYTAYKLVDKELMELDYIPLDRLTNADRIDLKNRAITIVDNDGAYDYAEFCFSFKERKTRIEHLPNFYSTCASNFDYDKYNKELGSPFALESIREYAKTNAEHRSFYKVSGNSVIRQ